MLISGDVDKSLLDVKKKKQSLLEQIKHTYVGSHKKKLEEELIALEAKIAAVQGELEERQVKLF